LAAADPKVRLAYSPSASQRGNLLAIAQGFLKQYRALFGLRDSRQELTLTRVEADAQLNYSHVRLGQVYRFVADAMFRAELTNENGDVLSTLEELSSAQGDDTWRQAKIDLSKFAGKSVRLTFSAQNPRGNVSSFFVDDLSLAACTSGAGPAKPPAPSQSGVIVEGTITNVDTGRGIAGAQVFILKPGLGATDAFAYELIARVGRKNLFAEVFEGSIPEAFKPLIQQLNRLLPTSDSAPGPAVENE